MNYAPIISNALKAAALAARIPSPSENARQRIRNSAHMIFVNHLDRGLRHSCSVKHPGIYSFTSCYRSRNELKSGVEFRISTTSVEAYEKEIMICNVLCHLVVEREPDTVLSVEWDSFYSLVLSNADDKLFIGALVDDTADYLNTLAIIARANVGGLQVALIPHHSAWKDLQSTAFELWAWDSDQWLKIVGPGA
jgi:hypothetical protein